MMTPRRLIAGGSFAVATAVAVAVTVAVAPAGAATSPAISTACGTPLSASEIATIVTLSDSATLPADPLTRYDSEVTRDRQITSILVAHKDFRGLFAVGLDASERAALQPLQHDASNFSNPTFARTFSGALLGRWLVAVHAQFLGRGAEPQWQRYFDLAHQCSTSKVQTSIAGYNAHLNVDVAHALATAKVTQAVKTDYLKVVGAVALSAPLLISSTQAAYGTNIGPVLGVVLQGATAITELAFVNGLALQVPALTAITEAELQVLWRATDAVLPVLVAIYGG